MPKLLVLQTCPIPNPDDITSKVLFQLFCSFIEVWNVIAIDCMRHLKGEYREFNNWLEGTEEVLHAASSIEVK